MDELMSPPIRDNFMAHICPANLSTAAGRLMWTPSDGNRSSTTANPDGASATKGEAS